MRSSRNKWIRTAVVAGVSSVFGASALATDNVWTGAQDTNWNNPNNWSLGRVPVNPNGQVAPADTFDDAVVNTNTGNIATITADIPVPRDIILGSGAGTNGQLNQTAGLALTGEGNWFYVGRDGGTATYNLTGSGSLDVGRGNNPASTGGRLYVGGTEFGAGGANGTFNVNTTGTVNVRNDLAVGTDGSTGVMTVDAGTITTGGWNFIGKHQNAGGANGTLTMNGGVVNNGGRTYVAHNGGTTGVMNLQGGNYNNGEHFIIGEGTGSSGTVNVTNAASNLAIGQELWIGQAGGGNGTMNVSAGQVTVGSWLAAGREGSQGLLNISGTGSVTKSGGGAVVIGTNTGGTATVNISGGSFTTAEKGPFDPLDPNTKYNNDIVLGELNGAHGTVLQTGGTVTIGGDLRLAGKETTETGGSGTYTLQGGTLDLTGGSIIPGGGTAVFDFAGGRLKNAANVNIPLTQAAGTIAPGASGAGTTNLTAGYTMTGGTYEAELQGGTTTSDLLNVTGVATIAGALDTVPLGTMTVGDTYTILTASGGITGIFANAPAGSYSEDGITYNISYGNNSVTLSVTAVPEPASLGLIGLSAGTFLLRRRRMAAVAG